MRIAITGASGFVASQLVPILARQGVELLLVGRQPEELARTFPDQRTCGYDQLATEATGYDVLLHLAVLNNDAKATPAEFMAVNVDFLLDVLAMSRQAGVRRFVNVSSTHALGAARTDPYSASKRAAADRLRDQPDVTTLYLPSVYGDRWSGRLGILNRLPRPAARILFFGLASLKPVVHVQRLADYVLTAQGPDPELIVTDGQRHNWAFRVAKGAVDFSFALTVLVLFWWVLLMIWLWVRLGSPGPGFFIQSRIGANRARFACYKFRTMAMGTAEVGTHDAPQDAVTRAGRFLRQSKLDELPQVINILRGEVSLVGPRPCLPVQTELIDARLRRGVYTAPPGITGLAQVNGIDMSDPEMLARWDSHYVALQCLPLDIAIMLATARRPRAGSTSVVPGWAGEGN